MLCACVSERSTSFDRESRTDYRDKVNLCRWWLSIAMLAARRTSRDCDVSWRFERWSRPACRSVR